MKTFLTPLFAVALVATAVVGANSTAARANDVGLGVAAGIIGGVAVGAAIASQPRERVIIEERPRRVYEDEPEVTCRRVRRHDDYGNVYFKRECHRHW